MGNGLVERLNGTLVRMLAMYVCDNQSIWDILLPGVCFGYATSAHQTTKETPFFLLYGRRARLPNNVTSWTLPNLSTLASNQAQIIIKNIQLSQEIARTNNQNAQKKMKAHYGKKAKDHNFKVGDKVLLRQYMRQVGKNKKFSDKYRGPYTLVGNYNLSRFD